MKTAKVKANSSKTTTADDTIPIDAVVYRQAEKQAKRFGITADEYINHCLRIYLAGIHRGLEARA